MANLHMILRKELGGRKHRELEKQPRNLPACEQGDKMQKAALHASRNFHMPLGSEYPALDLGLPICSTSSYSTLPCLAALGPNDTRTSTRLCPLVLKASISLRGKVGGGRMQVARGILGQGIPGDLPASAGRRWISHEPADEYSSFLFGNARW